MEPFFGDHLLASRARALDSRVPHLYCNRCGEEVGIRFVGGSRAVRADGSIETEASGAGEELVAVAVGPSGAADHRLDYLALLRGEIGVRALMTGTGGTR
jgi:predicted amidohydrolase